MRKFEEIQTAGNTWWKAFLISVILHGALLTSIGWFVMNVSVDIVPPDDYIELDLADSGRGGDAVDSTLADVISQQAVVTSESAATASVVSNGNTTPSLRASVSGLSMLSGVSSSTNDGHGTSSESATVGQGSAGGASNDSFGLGESGQGSGGPGKSRGSVIRPIIIQPMVEPIYPEQARQQGIEGKVKVDIDVSASGYPNSVKVSQTSGNDLLDAALVEAAQQWRFHPAYYSESGETTGCVITVPYRFRI